MTQTLSIGRRLLTVADYAAVGDDENLRWSELVEGHLVMAPGPSFRHVRALQRLLDEIANYLPAHLERLNQLDVDLMLAAPHEPGTVRQPDVVVVTKQETARLEREGGFVRASGVVLAAEIVSPGSRRTDRLIKRAEYADAGIPHYWIVELEPTVTLTACRLVDAPLYAWPPERMVSGTSKRSAHLTTARTSAASRTLTTAGGRMPSKRRLKSSRAAS